MEKFLSYLSAIAAARFSLTQPHKRTGVLSCARSKGQDMSEYRVLKVEGKPPFFLEYQLLAPNGRLLIEANQYAADSLINARDILNQETTKLQEEIASLQEAAAEKDSVIEAQSEKLGEARNFIEELAMANPGYERIADWIDRAKKLAKQWEAAELEAAE